MPEGRAPSARVAAAVIIHAPRDRVWDVLTDFSDMHRWFFGVRAVRVVGQAGAGAGREVTFVGGFTHREVIRGWEPPARLALVSAGHSGLIAAGNVDIRLEDGAEGVRLDWSIDYRLGLGRLAAAVSRPVVQGLVGAALRISLRRLMRIAEAPVRI